MPLACPHTAYAATPAAAARAIACRSEAPRAVLVRIDTSGRFASVLLSGGIIEGSPLDKPLLIERFSFGWQPLAALETMCDLQQYRLGAARDAALTRGMPPIPVTRGKCPALFDRGPNRDMQAIRKVMRGPLVPWVHAETGR